MRMLTLRDEHKLSMEVRPTYWDARIRAYACSSDDYDPPRLSQGICHSLQRIEATRSDLDGRHLDECAQADASVTRQGRAIQSSL